MTLSLTTSTRGDFCVVAVAGAVDVHTAPELRAEATRVLSGGTRKLVLDLTDVDFLDSSALGAIVGIHKDIAALGGALRVVCEEPKLLRIFEITRLTEVLSITPTVAAAVDDG